MGEGIINYPGLSIPGTIKSMPVASGYSIKRNQWVSNLAVGTVSLKGSLYYYEPVYIGDLSNNRFFIIYNKSNSSGSSKKLQLDLIQTYSNGTLSVLSTEELESSVSITRNVAGLHLSGDNYVICYMTTYKKVKHLAFNVDNTINITTLHENKYRDSSNFKGCYMIRGAGPDEYYFAMLQGNDSDGSSIGHGNGASIIGVVEDLAEFDEYTGSLGGFCLYNGILYFLFEGRNYDYIITMNASSLSIISKTQQSVYNPSGSSSVDLGDGLIFCGTYSSSVGMYNWVVYDVKSNTIKYSGAIPSFEPNVCFHKYGDITYLSGISNTYDSGHYIKIVNSAGSVLVSKESQPLNASTVNTNVNSFTVKFENNFFSVLFSSSNDGLSGPFDVNYYPGIVGVVPYSGSNLVGIATSDGNVVVDVKVPTIS